MKKDHLVIGLGEVGSALQRILKCDGIDTGEALMEHYEMIHICFPFSDTFIESVKKYHDKYKGIVVVHSSVPIGTCGREGWVHSPVRGVHPNLELGIRTFVKYFGSDIPFFAFEAAKHFAHLGVKVRIVDKAANTEALKLWDTTQYGAMILLEKEIKRFCDERGLDFDLIYTEANRSYNAGYLELGRPDVVRPFLKDMQGKIGGHCVVENSLLLDSPTARRIIDENSQL